MHVGVHLHHSAGQLTVFQAAVEMGLADGNGVF